MKKQKGKKKAFLAVLLSTAVICQTFPAYSLAAQGPDGICPHHTEHTEACGYQEAAACQFVCEECIKEAAEAEKAVQEAQKKIDNVQSLISALPEADSITEENLESVKGDLAAIEAAKAELDETQQAALNMEKYNAAVERIAAIEAKPQKAPTDTQEAGNDVATVTIDGVETGYPTLEAAIEAANGNTATITLLQSIDKTEEASYYDIYGGNITLSLNGCSVETSLYIKSGSIKVIGEGALYWLSFVNDGIEAVIESGNITTLGVTGSSKVTIAGGDVEKFNVVGNATAIITGGTIHVLNGGNAGSGSITVKGGTIESITDTVSNINYEVENVTLDQSELSLQVNEQKTLSATVTPNISAPGFPVWESSDTDVATVSNGTVTAVGDGTADITVTAGNKSQTCKVTVGAVASVTINGQTQNYTNLDSAIQAAGMQEATITLLKDTAVGNQPIQGNITLVGGEHTLTKFSALTITGTLTIKSGNYVGDLSLSSGTLNIDGGTFQNITANTGSTIHVTAGTFDSLTNAVLMPLKLEIKHLTQKKIYRSGGGLSFICNMEQGKIVVAGKEQTIPVTCESSDKNVFTVEPNKYDSLDLYYKSPGTATVIITAGGKSITREFEILDPGYVISIPAKVKIGESYKIDCKIAENPDFSSEMADLDRRMAVTISEGVPEGQITLTNEFDETIQIHSQLLDKPNGNILKNGSLIAKYKYDENTNTDICVEGNETLYFTLPEDENIPAGDYSGTVTFKTELIILE